MCSLRTVDGLKFSQIEYLMSENDLNLFKKLVLAKADSNLSGLISVTNELIKLDPKRAFIVSNSVISEILLCLPEN